MKATLCVFVALVAITSAAPTFNMRRAACTATGWCTSGGACECPSAAENCNADTKYCTGAATTKVMSTKCGSTDGTTGLTSACACGAPTVTHTGDSSTANAKAAFFTTDPTAAAPGYCLLSKAANSDAAATTRASVDMCPSIATGASQWNNAKTTCGADTAINGCASGNVCKVTGGAGVCMPVCTPSTAAAPGTAATAACKCGSDFVDVAIGGFCGLKADGTGVALAKAVCATAKGDGKTDLSAAAAQCNCGSAATDATGAAKEYCLLGTGGVTGTALAEPVCTPSTAAAPGSAATAACKCGSDFVDVTTGGFCGLKADGTGV